MSIALEKSSEYFVSHIEYWIQWQNQKRKSENEAHKYTHTPMYKPKHVAIAKQMQQKYIIMVVQSHFYATKQTKMKRNK